MAIRNQNQAKVNESIRDSSDQLQQIDQTERHSQEMKRRFEELHYRRNRLEHELKAVNAALTNLNSQLQTCAAYKQLSM